MTASTMPGGTRALLSQLHETDQAEIKLGKLAEQKASNDQARSFAEQLVQDHTDASS
jgi:predicted outer membrane protein